MALTHDEIASVLKGIESKRGGLDEHKPSFRGRALEIAMLKARGLTNKEVASQLRIDPHTVSEYVRGEVFQLLLEEVREKAIDQQSDLNTRLKKEADQNIETLVGIRDDLEASPDTRRRTAMDLLGLLRDPPGGKEHVKQTIRVFMQEPATAPKVIDGVHEEIAPRAVPLRLVNEKG